MPILVKKVLRLSLSLSIYKVIYIYSLYTYRYSLTYIEEYLPI